MAYSSYKREWVVMTWEEVGWYDDPSPVTALFAINPGDHRKYHWNGNFQWTSPSDNWRLVKSYGFVGNKDFEREAAICKDYSQSFPLSAHNIRLARVADMDGFLSPDGTVYRCHYGGHTNLADTIIDMIDPDCDYVSDPYGELQNRGWLAIRHGHIGKEWNENPVTAEQMAFLNLLYDLTERFDNYRLGIVEFRRYTEKHGQNWDLTTRPE